MLPQLKGLWLLCVVLPVLNAAQVDGLRPILELLGADPHPRQSRSSQSKLRIRFKVKLKSLSAFKIPENRANKSFPFSDTHCILPVD